MKILVCTIVRDRAATLPLWRSQLVDLFANSPEIEWHVSVVENSSKDGSDMFIRQATFPSPNLASYQWRCEGDLGTPYYGSVKNAERCHILATQRNKAMDCWAFNNVDKILWLEPDIRYNPKSVKPLLYSEADIISPRSTQGGCEMYDSWSVRLDSQAEDCFETIRDERGVYSTWCQFCVINATVMQKWCIQFSGWNDRRNAPDNDVVSISEAFRKRGHGDIRINGSIIVEHLPH